MKDPAAQFSPQDYARIGGVLYLIIIAAGLFAEAFVRSRLIVPADAAATATINSFTLVLYPPLASILLLLPAFIGELSFALWLTVKGVNVPEWKEKAGVWTRTRASPVARMETRYTTPLPR